MKYMLKLTTGILLILPLCSTFAQLKTLTNIEADSIIETRYQAEAARKAERIAELEKATVKSEGRTTLANGQEVIIREVEPPPNVGASLVTPAAAKPEPSGNPQALDLSQLSPEQLAHYEAWQARTQKEQQVIMLSATVYEHAVTRLSWRFADGSEPSEYIAFTNADFNLLRGTHALSTDSHDFTFFMGIGDASSEDNPYSNKTVPDLSNFSSQRSEYLVIQGDPEHEAAFAGIEALLAHYDTNLAELKIKQQRREALTAAKQRYDAKHPETEPEPFIMEFWVPEKSAKP